MGKRSDFPRRPMDNYATPYAAILPLLPHLVEVYTFAEPCCGEGKLIEHLERHRLKCVLRGDLRTGVDALTIGAGWFKSYKPDVIITNPPWTRELMHPLIHHLMQLAPTWLLIDADWAHTKQASPYLMHCSRIVSIGRVRWIEGSANDGKDNAAWYRFDVRHQTGPRFFPRQLEMEVA